VSGEGADHEAGGQGGKVPSEASIHEDRAPSRPCRRQGRRFLREGQRFGEAFLRDRAEIGVAPCLDAAARQAVGAEQRRRILSEAGQPRQVMAGQPCGKALVSGQEARAGLDGVHAATFP
jgi:hypothetical protein